MKKASMFFLFIILFSSCAPQTPTISDITTPSVTATSILTPTITLTPRPTLTATATLIPCPESGIFAVGEIQVFFEEQGITSEDCHFFAYYVAKINDWAMMNGYSTTSAEIHVFNSAEAVTDFEYDWARMAGCNPDSKENILQSWRSGGAHASIGSAFFMVTGWWDQNPKSERVVALVHEFVHIIQGNYAGSCPRMWQIPDWFKEGQAHYFGRLLASEWGIDPGDVRANLLGCKYKLSQLIPGQDCIYMQGEQAFILLREKYGEKSMEVFIEISKGKSFNQSFYDTYKISVSAFSDDFDAYRLSGYTLPVSTTPTP